MVMKGLHSYGEAIKTCLTQGQQIPCLYSAWIDL